MTTPSVGRPYICAECGQTKRTPEMNGRIPAYCPDCRPRVAKRGGAGGFDSGTLVYRLAISVTALQLGVDRARHALLQANLDGRASVEDLRRAVAFALVALDEADANWLTELTAADLVDGSASTQEATATPDDARPEAPDRGR